MGVLGNMLADWSAQIGGGFVVLFGFLLVISGIRNPQIREEVAVTIGIGLIALGGLLFGGDCIINGWQSCQLVTLWEVILNRIVEAIRAGSGEQTSIQSWLAHAGILFGMLM